MIAGKDISEKRLEEYSDVFADMVNVLLFDGEEVINPDDLEDAPTFSAYQGKDKLRKLERAICINCDSVVNMPLVIYAEICGYGSNSERSGIQL